MWVFAILGKGNNSQWDLHVPGHRLADWEPLGWAHTVDPRGSSQASHRQTQSQLEHQLISPFLEGNYRQTMCICLEAELGWGGHQMALLSLTELLWSSSACCLFPEQLKNFAVFFFSFFPLTAGRLTLAVILSSPAVSSTSTRSTRDVSVRNLSTKSTLISSRRSAESVASTPKRTAWEYRPPNV